MDINNTPKGTVNGRNQSSTRLPRWQKTTLSDEGAGSSQSSTRKFYGLLLGWLLFLGAAVAASLGGISGGDQPVAGRGELGENAFTPRGGQADSASGAPEREVQRPQVNLLNEPDNSMPASFRSCQVNEVSQPELLQQAAFVLAEGQRPLRVLQIGDSHVAGRTFPQAVKETLTHCLGQADSPDEGTGVYFSYIGSNGATSKRFLSDSYMQQFADKRPDLIILSLGTNEAHGMGYREDLHESQLNTFFARLSKACPDAEILLTTPPGDYLSTSYVSYRSTSRKRRRVQRVSYGRRPNPMSARCASFIADYGYGHHMAVWDLFSICGGEEAAQSNWTENNYMRADRIHFEPAGYAIQGHLLGEAIVRALSDPAGGTD